MRIIRTAGQHPALGHFFCYQQLPWFRLSIMAFAGLVGVMIFAFPETIFASGADSNPTIRIRVNNYTQATPAMLAGAEREAGRILGKAGLQTVWLDCPAGHSTADPQDLCGEPLEATDIVLRVLSQSTQNKFQDTLFGFAVVPVLASVYYDYAIAMHLARSDGAEFEIPIILGCVIAHEVGHLLLGSNSHSVSGIMQGNWERGQIRQAMTGTLLFTPEQAKLVQAETQSRMKLRTASLRERGLGTVAGSAFGCAAVTAEAASPLGGMLGRQLEITSRYAHIGKRCCAYRYEGRQSATPHLVRSVDLPLGWLSIPAVCRVPIH